MKRILLNAVLLALMCVCAFGSMADLSEQAVTSGGDGFFTIGCGPVSDGSQYLLIVLRGALTEFPTSVNYDTDVLYIDQRRAESGRVLFQDCGLLENTNATAFIAGNGLAVPMIIGVTNDSTPAKLPGDANGDTLLDTLDITLLLNYYLHGVNAGIIDVVAADYNSDGVIDTEDMLLIKMKFNC